MAYFSSLTLTLNRKPITGSTYPSHAPAWENYGSVFLTIDQTSLQVWGTAEDIAGLGQTIVNLADRLRVEIEEARTQRLPDPVEAFHANLSAEEAN